MVCLSLAHQEEKELVSPLTPSDVDWDSLYEEAVEEEEVDMKSHGSVITHLLSQESLVDFSSSETSILLKSEKRINHNVNSGADWYGFNENCLTNLHPGEKVPPGNVCRLLCSPRHLHGDLREGES